jgi:hypothetical protein
LLVLLALAGGFLIYTSGPKLSPDQVAWGVTFSNHEAKDLKLDPQQTYLATLDELHPKRLRLVAYWSDIEQQPGHYDFHELDFQVAEAEKRGIPYVITVGVKLPRWPECFAPDWAAKLPAAEEQQRLFAIDTQTVRRYDARPHLAAWQVENEPYLKFGQGCPGFVASALPDEVKLVRSLSAKAIRLTDSGEFSTWFLASRFGDEFGTTLYRAVLMGNTTNVFHYFWWPDFYTRRATLIKKLHPNVHSVVISELQAEPWGLAPDLPQTFYDKTMSHEQFLANVNFASQVGLAEADLWGVEWWYYEKTHGDSFYWEAAKDLFERSAQ